ncbi:MAG TPA: CheR family methyltransferase, partial [Burkholderiales bacterium]|nr:CheR family methyltransferase [Burkholderiales bacterium]
MHPDEFGEPFNTVLINATSFFRDAAAWETLARDVVPELVTRKPPHDAVRAWSAGCATGEEAYTLAMVLAEAMGPEAFRDRAKVYATDVDQDALSHARLAAYSAARCSRCPRRCARSTASRQTAASSPQPPAPRGDLRSCTSMPRPLARVLRKFHFARAGEGQAGHLFPGRAEMLMLLTHSALFNPLDLKCRIFTAVLSPRARLRAAANEATAPLIGGPDLAGDKLRELALEDPAVARILIDLNGVLTFANHRARTLFSLHAKDLGRPLSELELSYRPLELRSVIEQAYAERRPISRPAVERRLSGSEAHYLDVTVSPLLEEGGAPLGVAVTFVDVTRFHRLQDELRVSREELQTTKEELQSSNEELETTNEELQSTNEELETMNEELQSINEELNAVNAELRQRTDQLHQSNTFLESVLASLPGAAVVVDTDLHVLVWSARAEDLWGLRAEAVNGRSLLNLDIGLPVGELRAPGTRARRRNASPA